MVTIYYRTRKAMERRPVPSAEEGLDQDDYELVAQLKNEEAPDLEEIFQMFNVVNGDELPVKLNIRSMMPGDVVVDEVGDVWFCDFNDWTQAWW